jgi:colicin import membrane protein
MAALTSAALPWATLASSTYLQTQQQKQRRQTSSNQLAQARAALDAEQKADEASAALTEQQQAETAANSIQQISGSADATEQRRIASLRRAVAKRQAALAAHGISSGDGSGEAILLGLVHDSDDEAEANASSDALKIDAIRQQLEQTRQRNLLELSTAAQRRNQRLIDLAGSL